MSCHKCHDTSPYASSESEGESTNDSIEKTSEGSVDLSKHCMSKSASHETHSVSLSQPCTSSVLRLKNGDASSLGVFISLGPNIAHMNRVIIRAEVSAPRESEEWMVFKVGEKLELYNNQHMGKIVEALVAQ